MKTRFDIVHISNLRMENGYMYAILVLSVVCAKPVQPRRKTSHLSVFKLLPTNFVSVFDLFLVGIK